MDSYLYYVYVSFFPGGQPPDPVARFARGFVCLVRLVWLVLTKLSMGSSEPGGIEKGEGVVTPGKQAQVKEYQARNFDAPDDCSPSKASQAFHTKARRFKRSMPRVWGFPPRKAQTKEYPAKVRVRSYLLATLPRGPENLCMGFACFARWGLVAVHGWLCCVTTWFELMTHQQAGPSSLSKKHQINQLHSSDGAPPTTAGRAKRENGGLGEDPPGSPMTNHQVVRICPLHNRTTRRAERCREHTKRQHKKTLTLL
jgi:hypothetical protein